MRVGLLLLQVMLLLKVLHAASHHAVQVSARLLVLAAVPFGHMQVLGGHLHLAAQRAQGRVDVQVLEGAAVPTEHVVEHRGQIEVPSEDIGAFEIAGQQRGRGHLPQLAPPLGKRLLALVPCRRFWEVAHGRVLAVLRAVGGAGGQRPALSLGAEICGRHPPSLEDTIDKHVGVLRVNLPEPPLPRLILLPGHLHEALVQRQIVANRILEEIEIVEMS